MKRKNVYLYISVLIIVIVIVFYLGRRQGEDLNKIEQTAFMMDTVVNITVYSDNESQAKKDISEVIDLMAELENKYSRHVDGSDISRINNAAGRNSVRVDDGILSLINKSLRYSRLSEGRFDITVAPLIDEWGFASGEYKVPNPQDLKQVLELIDYNIIQINSKKKSVYLPIEGMGIDLGAIAKGYIIDRGAELLLEKGYASGYVDAGGDMRLIGEKPGNKPWRIGIKHPLENGQLGVISLTNKSVVTSGDYERFFESGGIRYHHILDAVTGMPAAGTASVTIVSDNAASADALATTVFLLGADAGKNLIEGTEGIEAVIVDKNGEVFISSGLDDIYTED